jgi:hypothetical protein
MFAQCLIALTISITLGSRKALRSCIQLVTTIVLDLHQTLLRPLPDLWLSLHVMFIPYLNNEFSLDTDRATSCWGTRIRAGTTECDVTAEQASSCFCNEIKHSVNKTERLDDAKEIAF